MSEKEELMYSRVLHEDMEKFFQWRVAVSEFRGKQYLNIRKWFLSFEGEWLPSKEGASIPLSIVATAQLVIALGDILSEAEKEDLHPIVKEIFKIEHDRQAEDDIPF